MYRYDLDLKFNIDEIENLAKMIVAPPDDGIDIVIERDEGDENRYEFIQVTSSQLTPREVKATFREMKESLKNYQKAPNLVTPNLQQVLGETNFDNTINLNGEKCKFYVVHSGNVRELRGLNDNEYVTTFEILKALSETEVENGVPEDILIVDEYRKRNRTNSRNEASQTLSELVVDLNGEDLAVLCNKYSGTPLGINTLFYQNFREGLGEKTQSKSSMYRTIDLCPELFWDNNNGMTIVASSYEWIDEEAGLIKLKDFSITNGAQTTSTLGTYLRDLELESDEIKERKRENLKKVRVLVRILIRSNHELRKNIAIYNNTQDAIINRDMVSNNIEQKKLQQKYLRNQEPNIYIAIRRGQKEPRGYRILKHQKTTNELLAQYTLAAFAKEPFSAKDKKKNLFNTSYDNNSEFIVNREYHRIFNYDEDNEENNGLIFRRSKEEIDELLFWVALYKESRKYLKKYYDEQIQITKTRLIALAENPISNELEKNRTLNRLTGLTRNKSISSICLFYFLTFVYYTKEYYGNNNVLVFEYDKYYFRNDLYKGELIKECTQIFLEETVAIISEVSIQHPNLGTWIRTRRSQDAFFHELDKRMRKSDYADKFTSFFEKYSGQV